MGGSANAASWQGPLGAKVHESCLSLAALCTAALQRQMHDSVSLGQSQAAQASSASSSGLITASNWTSNEPRMSS